MDDDFRWWAFGRTQSLGLQDKPKVGVARLVSRLTAAADPDGAVFLDNVDVNGVVISEQGPTTMELTAILNSRPLDFAFRQHTVRFQNGFFGANKQFIAPLPIPDEIPSALDRLGTALHASQVGVREERRAFLVWLESLLEAPLDELAGRTLLYAYDTQDQSTYLRVLDQNARALAVDPRSRAIRERLIVERETSVAAIADLQAAAATDKRQVDDLLFDAFELSLAHRAVVSRHFET